jgi:hypothetical protein
MLDTFTPEDNNREDSDYHKQVRAQTQQPTTTADDKEFTIEEIRDVIKSMDKKKAPREDGITCDIYNHTFHILPKSITAMYNGCLRNGIFPKRWKRAKIIPITKPGKEEAMTYLNTAQLVFYILEVKYLRKP